MKAIGQKASCIKVVEGTVINKCYDVSSMIFVYNSSFIAYDEELPAQRGSQESEFGKIQQIYPHRSKIFFSQQPSSQHTTHRILTSSQKSKRSAEIVLKQKKNIT